jgi:hypothetical protein
MLFDPETKRLTAVLDYDFGHIASQADEYTYSFPSVHGLLIPPGTGDPDIDQLRINLLHGFDGESVNKTAESVDWKVAVALDEAFKEAGVERPSDIPGSDELSSLFWLIQNISPPMFFLRRWMDKASPEKIDRVRSAAEASVAELLETFGF